jgi:hypothetical protein
MIDHPDRVARLLDRLQAVLPLPARMTPELVATLANNHTGITPACAIVSVNYAGDEGGIVCQLNCPTERNTAIYASITHLRFDPRVPTARDILVYQKHRVKALRRQPR